VYPAQVKGGLERLIGLPSHAEITKAAAQVSPE
jgi:hypothetical protein